MKKGAIEKTLRDFGLNEKEVEVYVLLGKRVVLKGGDISKKLKIHRGQVYRTLRSLQKRGLVEKTLEYPARFTAVPLEQVIEGFIKSKREDVTRIEETKKDLLSDWEKISQIELDSSLEKFSVIEGEKKIFRKISQMIKETKGQFPMKLTVSDLFVAEQFGVFDTIDKHPLKSKIQFRVLTQGSKQNLKAIKLLKTKLENVLNFRGNNPSLGSPPFTRMAIRDNDEILLFISDKNKESLKDRKKVCLCTNCKSIIRAFSSVFQDSWQNSTSIEQLINLIELGKSSPKTKIIKDPSAAKQSYYEMLDSTNEEILIVTSSEGLIALSKNKAHLEELYKRGISISIMAPIVNENLDVTRQLLKWCEIRHVSIGYFETTIIDGHHLFQFRPTSSAKRESAEMSYYANTLYTNDLTYIQKTKNILDDIWRKTRTPSLESLRSITRFQPKPEKSSNDYHYIERKTGFMKNMEYKKRNITEKDVQDKINTERKRSNRYNASWTDIIRFFGYKGFAAIYPPTQADLPDMIIGVIHHDKDSTYGVENWIYISMMQKTAEAVNYVPIAIIQDNAKSLPFRKRAFAGYPVANNIMVLEKNEIQVKVRGNTLFAGWTKAIPLGHSNYILPSACLLFEGYGDINSGMFTNTSLAGRTAEVWHNSFDAFSSFFLPQLKYVGSGTEAFFERETILISRPPKLINKT